MEKLRHKMAAPQQQQYSSKSRPLRSKAQERLHRWVRRRRRVCGTWWTCGRLGGLRHFVEDEDGVIWRHSQAVALVPKDIEERVMLLFVATLEERKVNWMLLGITVWSGEDSELQAHSTVVQALQGCACSRV